MQKVNLLNQKPADTILAKLLLQRKAPLTEEGLRLALTDLTLYLSGNVSYYAVVYPKQEVALQQTIQANEIDRADMMEGTDGERYFPVFTEYQKLLAWKGTIKKGEAVYLMDKQDLLKFLNHNASVAACVVNPHEDDLLLHRIILQNMISMSQQ